MRLQPSSSTQRPVKDKCSAGRGRQSGPHGGAAGGGRGQDHRLWPLPPPPQRACVRGGHVRRHAILHGSRGPRAAALLPRERRVLVRGNHVGAHHRLACVCETVRAPHPLLTPVPYSCLDFAGGLTGIRLQLVDALRRPTCSTSTVTLPGPDICAYMHAEPLRRRHTQAARSATSSIRGTRLPSAHTSPTRPSPRSQCRCRSRIPSHCARACTPSHWSAPRSRSSARFFRRSFQRSQGGFT